ncbi:MAG: DMT family transporter [Bacteroidia bacterium]
MTQLQGILFALCTTLSWSVGIFPFTEAARRLGSNTLNHFRLLLAMVLLAVTASIIDPGNFIHIFSGGYAVSWMWLSLSGIVGLTIGDYFVFKAFAIFGARIGSVLTTLAPAAALLVGSLLLSENINVTGIIGMAITIAGVIGISFGRKERNAIPDHGHGTKFTGIIMGILGAACQGVGLVLSKKGMMDASAAIYIAPVTATFMRITSATVILFLFSLVQGSTKEVLAPVFANRQQGIKYAVAGTICGPFLGVTFSLAAIRYIDASVAQTIFSLVPAGALLISFLFYKEKITLQSLTGVIVALSGVLILIWRDYLQQLLLQ